MNLKHELSDNNGFFFIEDNNHRIATISFTFSESNIIIVEHTVVDKAYEGRGIARQLVNAVVDYARKNNYRILPHCPYTKKVLESSSEFNDILYK